MGSIKKVIYSGREFVNTPGNDDTGYVQAEIKWEYNYGFEDDGSWRDLDDDDNDDEDSKTGAPGNIEYQLKFADCNRIIDFNIRGGSPSERANSIYKVDKMIEVLQGFRKGLDEAFVGEEDIKNYRAAKRLKDKKKFEDQKKLEEEKSIQIKPLPEE